MGVTGADETRSNGGNIQDELISQDSNVAGTIAMANTGQPNSGGSQIFFNVADNLNLNWWDTSTPSKHPVFAKVTEGYDLLVQISQVPRTTTTLSPRSRWRRSRSPAPPA